MSRTSPETAILDAAKRMQSFNALTQLVPIPWDDIDPQERNHWFGLACAALRGGHPQTPTDAAHVRSALETLSDTSKISVDGTGIDRLINLIDRMRQIAANALLRLPEVSDTSTDRTSK